MPATTRTALCAAWKLPGNDPDFGKALELLMLPLLPGQGRTRPEFERIFARAGFRITQVTPAPGTMSMIEAVPA